MKEEVDREKEIIETKNEKEKGKRIERIKEIEIKTRIKIEEIERKVEVEVRIGKDIEDPPHHQKRDIRSIHQENKIK